MADVVIVDAGLGNVGSVLNMCRKIGAEAVLATSPAELDVAERLILPGVGAFDFGMERLRVLGLVEPLTDLVINRRCHVLGVCLGMQLLFERSDEGDAVGLSWITGHVRRLPASGPRGPIKVPHMGWSRIRATRSSPLIEGLHDDARFYFVHSFAAAPTDEADVLARSDYGGVDFVSIVEHGNVAGVQFHPEKSHRHGMALLGSFLQR